jgi:hypothetical protein
MLVTTLMIMGVATFCMGLLPSYEQAGKWSLILLTLLRCFQVRPGHAVLQYRCSILSYSRGGHWGGGMTCSVRVIAMMMMMVMVMVLYLRFQGLGLGGEWGGSVLMAYEFAPPRYRGLFAAIPQVSIHHHHHRDHHHYHQGGKSNRDWDEVAVMAYKFAPLRYRGLFAATPQVRVMIMMMMMMMMMNPEMMLHRRMEKSMKERRG